MANAMIPACRMRITMTAPRGQLEMTVEVMSILPGVYLVDIAKVTGDSVDFYNSYGKITELVQPLITADALRRADSGQTTFWEHCHCVWCGSAAAQRSSITHADQDPCQAQTLHSSTGLTHKSA